MKDSLRTLLLLFAFSLPTLAQFTNVTGTVTDPNGLPYANGTISAVLILPGGTSPTLNGFAYSPPTQPIGLDKAGKFLIRLADNTVLLPTSTQWMFTVCSGVGTVQPGIGKGSLCFSLAAPITISGASQDISANLNAIALPLTFTTGGGGGEAGFAPIQKASASGSGDVGISGAIAALTTGNGIVWADYSTNQIWASCPTWGSGNVHLVLFPVTYAISVNCNIPQTVTLEFMTGALLQPATGTKTSIHGLQIGSAFNQRYANAAAGQGTIDLGSVGGGYKLTDVHMEWWGITPDNAGTTAETAALQAAIIGAYGNNRTSGSGLNKYNRCLEFSGNYSINAELQVYHMNGFCWKGINRLVSGITQQATNQRIIDGQSTSYGSFWNLQFGSAATQDASHPLIDFDFSGAQGADLRPQFFDCYNCTFLGNGVTAVGFQLAKSGGGAQGSNINFYNPAFQSFTVAGARCGTPTSYALNGIQIAVQFGDMQGMQKYGFASYGCGYISLYGTTMENQPLATQFANNGFDVYCEATQGPCILEHVRSESLKLIGASTMRVWDSGTGSGQVTRFFSPTSCLAGTGSFVNQIIMGSDIGGDGAYYLVSNSGTYSGLCTTNATGGSSTTITVAGTPWTTNQFAGQQATIIAGGTAQGEFCLITSNTSNTLTCSAGFVSNYVNNFAPLAIVAPDSTSQFVIEPQWGTTPTGSGTVTFARMNFNVIEGNLGFSSSDCELRNVTAPGGKIACAGSTISPVYLEEVIVTRPDWNAVNNPLEDLLGFDHYSRITIDRGNSRLTGALASAKLGWKWQRNGIQGYFDFSQMQLRTLPVCWAAGGQGGGPTTFDGCIRGEGALGAQQGRFQVINNSTGVQKITNFNADGSLQTPSVTFANLPASPNGSHIYCSDCNSTCTAGSSTGRTCFRENGAWTH